MRQRWSGRGARWPAELPGWHGRVTLNAARFVATLDTTTDLCLREALRQLLADEVQHGAFGFQYLEGWASWLGARGEVLASIDRYLRFAFAYFEQTTSGRGAASTPLTADVRALGLPDPLALAPVFYQTVEAAIVPGLERFGFEAGRAFRERPLSPP